jgi:hypothetical protein
MYNDRELLEDMLSIQEAFEEVEETIQHQINMNARHPGSYARGADKGLTWERQYRAKNLKEKSNWGIARDRRGVAITKMGKATDHMEKMLDKSPVDWNTYHRHDKTRKYNKHVKDNQLIRAHQKKITSSPPSANRRAAFSINKESFIDIYNDIL